MTAAPTASCSGKLLVNLRFPRLILPISAIIEAGVGFWFVRRLLRPDYPAERDPPIVGHCLDTGIRAADLFNVGLAASIARLAVPFRDIDNLLPFLFRLWLYLSPIIWPISTIEHAPAWAQTVMKGNPLYWLLEIYRGALLGRAITTTAWFAGPWAIVVLLVGVTAFVRQEGSMVRYL